MTAVLPASFKESSVTMSPVAGVSIKNLDDQIYGFISYKLAKFTDLPTLVDLLEANFDYDWDNFMTHWGDYLQQQGIEVTISMYENLLRKDIWGNYVRIKHFTIQFPGTTIINTPMVGEYAEQTMGKTTPPSTLYPSPKDTEWFDATLYEAIVVETLLPPDQITPDPRIIVSFMVTPLSKKGATFESVAADLSQNSNICLGRCEIHEAEETFSVPGTTPAEILFFVKNTPGMEKEINSFIDLVQSPLIAFFRDNAIPYKLGISTLSNPDELKTYNGKFWLDEKDDPDEFFKVGITTETLRNSMIADALRAVSRATERGLFNNSTYKTLVMISDRDDQSVTPDGEAISLNNLDSFIDPYNRERIFPYGIIGLTDQSSFYCDSPEPCTILKQFIFLMGGRVLDICTQYRGTFYMYLVREAMLNTSHMDLAFPPIKGSLSVETDEGEVKWGFPGGFYADSLMKKIILTPPASGKVRVNYSYFIKKY